MTRALTTIITLALIAISTNVIGQKAKLEEIVLTPKKKVAFSLDYKITRPRLQYPHWDNDFDKILRLFNTLTAQNAGNVKSY